MDYYLPMIRLHKHSILYVVCVGGRYMDHTRQTHRELASVEVGSCIFVQVPYIVPIYGLGPLYGSYLGSRLLILLLSRV